MDPERPIVSCLGYLRRYKGLELACQAVQHLKGEVQLLVAGPPRRGYNLRPVRDAAAALPNVILLDRWTTNQEFADFAAASDAVLLPYTQVTTSGALLAAWTLGSGVICSDLPFFRELLPEPSAAGRLFSANSSVSLAEAIRSYVSIPREQRACRCHWAGAEVLLGDMCPAGSAMDRGTAIARGCRRDSRWSTNLRFFRSVRPSRIGCWTSSGCS